MKQYNYEIRQKSKIQPTLAKLKAEISELHYSSLLFHVYTANYIDEEIQNLQHEILDVFPDALVAGTSTNGAICQGQLSTNGVVLAATVFDSTDVAVYLLDCPPGNETETGDKIREIIDSTSEIKAAEILITLKSINSRIVLTNAEKKKADIHIFGGGSADADISGNDTKVISNDSLSKTGVALVTYSGPDLIVEINHAIGWKPLGKDFAVTKIEGKHLYELDNVPAGQIYAKYLDIQADDDFFSNILEFPIMSHQHGYDVLRLPFSCLKEDNSIILAADIDKGTPVNLSYGDPDVIQADVRELYNKTLEFAPQAIFLYSCGVRRLYWKYLINKETGQFSSIAPVCGFYSSGEIMNMGDYIIEHHVTLIAVGMREGAKCEITHAHNIDRLLPMSDEQKIHNQISMVRRLANFINVTSAELREANEQLKEIAETDELTGLYNRRMLHRLVHDALHRAKKYNIPMTLGIVDIDNFKNVNDTYGHDIGDLVLKRISEAMYHEIEKLPSSIFGRWGGEEFLFIAPTLPVERILDNMEEARKRVSSTIIEPVGIVTISLGVTEFLPGDTEETLFKRADDALYEAKNTGKNKSCVK
ncbi:diguanylate cyclase [Pseudobutyrivibrio xylanivorans]|uniref:GGDEF domain-containing protein n=1 Tax=Pseudobutyrivibrio xylanivorans TaxID=185007 RepID=A0A5P6VVI2_PSEXY|nr:diguanylate cyclase [Pseudobutyrivibrio xylanivorans]QFJ55454.1 GGDEF domain-containing protein [Pseudobutyrivibrio xylanivorans]